MHLDVLRAELERLFELKDLLQLSREVLGFEPDEIGAAEAKGSFARALTEHCKEHDALEALCDAVTASRKDADPRIAEMAWRGLSLDDDLGLGAAFGPFHILRKIGAGRTGVCYAARRGDHDYRLKVLRREAARDRGGLQRYLAFTRLAATIEHPSLPEEQSVGAVGDRYYVAHRHVDGPTLAERLTRTGPMHINEARGLLKEIARSLETLHARRLTHGNLKVENVLWGRGSDGARALLVDAGCDRLRSRAPANGRSELLAVSAPSTVSPEQLQGAPPTSRSDVYAFGALVYQVVTGKPPFPGETPLEAIASRLTADPSPPSQVAPRGWVPADVDELVLSLLDRQPNRRPPTEALVDALEALGRAGTTAATARISDEALEERIATLLMAPGDEAAALNLAAAVDEGGDPARVAEAFRLAADSIESPDDGADRETKRSLLHRAARLYRGAAKSPEDAERAYAALVELHPDDEVALAHLEDLRKELGKYEELIEALLAQADRAGSGTGRAKAMAKIGRLYVTELDDAEQALVAYAQALCEDPLHEEYAAEIEQLAGTQREAWNEVLGACHSFIEEASAEDMSPEAKVALLENMGRWYSDRYGRADLALQCFQTILSMEPAREAALEGLSALYRKAKQWAELGMVLMRRADIAGTPDRARDLRYEAAELLEHQLSDPSGARDIYEQILAEDPGHEEANAALGRIYAQQRDFAGQVRVLERQAKALRGADRHRTLCRIAEVYEDELHDDAEAVKRYGAVLEEDPGNVDALKGLDRLHSKAGRFKDLLENLHAQLEHAATPRQKIALLERISGVYDEEFLDHAKAAEALERLLEIDAAHEPAMAQLARHYRADERWTALVDLYEKHLTLVSEPERRLELALARARVLSEQLDDTERAIRAYEGVLELDPEHGGALESLAGLREKAGQEDAALQAIERLADRADSPEARAEQYLRAAKLLESKGQLDAAIERYKLALDANPSNAAVSSALRAAYVARGDGNAAAELLERELEKTDGDRAKATLAAELARLALEKLRDDDRARKAASLALDHDPTNIQALTILGDLAFEAGHFVEAGAHYEKLASRVESLEHEAAVRILVRYMDALGKCGSTERALASTDALLRLAPDDAAALQRVAAVTFEHGAPKRARELYADLLQRFGDRLGDGDRALACYRLGESARRSGDLEEAIRSLEEAADLDPSSIDPLTALAEAYAQTEQWDEVVNAKTRQLDVTDGDDRVRLLIEIGELAVGKLGDRTRAAKSLVAALDERPDDRKLLMRLMQLYSEDKDWSKLVDVVVKLADFVDENKQKAKYLQTAAMVTGREMEDYDKALEFYRKVRELDPENEQATDESVELLMKKGDYEQAVELLQEKAKAASEARRTDQMLAAFTLLGNLYKEKLGRIGHAIDAFEAAQTLDPDNKERNEVLAELYASDAERYLDKAVAAQMAMLQQNPFRVESYKLLRRLYTETQRADPAWCLCQALYVLQLSEPDEERFFRRMRSEDPAYAQAVLADEDWIRSLLHPDADPLLTSLFALIEPAVIATRGKTFEELGYDSSYLIDPAQHPHPMSQTLYYAAGVLGMECPATFEHPTDPGGLSFLHAATPAIVLGQAALNAELHPQSAAFVTARHLTYFRPGLYMRHLVPSGTGLKSWLFAAIRMNAPQFPVAPDIEGPVAEAMAALDRELSPESRDALSRVVSKLLQSGGALDLRKWVQGIDLTADRAGFLLAHDLETSVEIIRASDESSAAVGPQHRLKELVLFAISDSYFRLREHLEVTVTG